MSLDSEKSKSIKISVAIVVSSSQEVKSTSEIIGSVVSSAGGAGAGATVCGCGLTGYNGLNSDNNSPLLRMSLPLSSRRKNMEPLGESTEIHLALMWNAGLPVRMSS